MFFRFILNIFICYWFCGIVQYLPMPPAPPTTTHPIPAGAEGAAPPAGEQPEALEHCQGGVAPQEEHHHQEQN